MKSRIARPGLVRSLRATAFFAGASALLISSGCSDSPNSVTAPDPGVETSDSTVPSMAEVVTELGLSTEQAAEVQVALDEWRRLAAASEVMEDLFLEDSPAVNFLSEVAATLSADQMVALRRLVARAVSARADGLYPDPTDRGPTFHGGIRGLFRNLDLTLEQSDAIRDALEAARAAARELCDQYRAGEISEVELREGRAQLRAELAATIDAILTEQQRAQLEQNKLDILKRRISALLAHYEARVDRRVHRLDVMLDLSESQETAITETLLAAKSDLESLLVDVEGGGLTAAAAWEAFHELQHATSEAVRAELTEAQREILDDLRDMHEPCSAGVEL